MTLRNAFADLATEPTLAAVLTELAQKYEGGPIVADKSAARSKFDYGTRSDAQPVYIGKAAPGVAPATAAWTITKLRYESGSADARLLEMDVRLNVAWDNRAAPTPAWEF